MQDDAISALLTGLEDRLRSELGHSARVERSEFLGGEGTSWAVHPVNPRSVPVQWWAFGDEIGLQTGRRYRGGRWELERTSEDVELVEAVVRAAIAGKVAETSAPARSCVEVTLEDGQVISETGYEGCLTGLLPLPGWRRWGKVVHFAPYASP
ncbi:hypothetical protein [Modestobacter marinus]|uniref:hypothetical protein n=1 Tax=Modestobacter marinus TaxID=477641 RepID=UPI001C93C1FF|nr:hypothetical protein [Modestobacter marinus]